MSSPPTFSKSLLHPRHWASWIAIGVFRVIAALPFGAKISAGKFFGLVAMKFANSRRHITETNVRLCFPELSDQQQAELVREIFVQNGIGFFEIAWSWWAKPEELSNCFDIRGTEILQEFAEQKKGVVVVGAHYVHLDLVGLMINQRIEMDVIYRKNNDQVFEYIITKGRKRVFKNVLERKDMRGIVKKLRQGRAVWYSPDQDYGTKQAVFAPFFGVNAATLVTTSRLAKMGNAAIVSLYHYRDPVTHRYQIVFEPLHADFPTGDDVTDATTINKIIEAGIRKAPAQYMWVHKRFKSRPKGEKSLY